MDPWKAGAMKEELPDRVCGPEETQPLSEPYPVTEVLTWPLSLARSPGFPPVEVSLSELRAGQMWLEGAGECGVVIRAQRCLS